MKARIYCVLFDNTNYHYDVTVEGDITILNIDDVVRKIKNKHRIPGKLFTVVTETNQMFQVKRVGRVWTKYELKGPRNEEH